MMLAQHTHSFPLLCSCFYLARVTLDLETILGASWEYTLHALLDYNRALETHAFAARGNLE